MSVRLISIAAIFVLSGIVITGCAGSGESQKEDVVMKRENTSDDIAARLDSLVKHSIGDYLHLQVGPCFGKCEMNISIYHDDREAHYYVYDAEGYRYNEISHTNDLLRLRKPIDQTVAEDMLLRVSAGGVFQLVPDTTMAITDQPYLWIRAKIGGSKISLDKVYTGGEQYVTKTRNGQPTLSERYIMIRSMLLEPLYALR